MDAVLESRQSWAAWARDMGKAANDAEHDDDDSLDGSVIRYLRSLDDSDDEEEDDFGRGSEGSGRQDDSMISLVGSTTETGDNSYCKWAGRDRYSTDGEEDDESVDDYDDFDYEEFETDEFSLEDSNVINGRSDQSCSGYSCSHPWAMEEITTNLKANESDFLRLELDDGIADIDVLLEAIQANHTVQEVEVHIEAFEGLSRSDQSNLAHALCQLPALKSLLVYKNSHVFIEPLLMYRPRLLENLRLCKLDISQPERFHLLVSALEALPLRALDVGFDNTDFQGVLGALARLKHIYVKLECFRFDYKLASPDDEDDENNNNDSSLHPHDKPSPFMLDDRIVEAIAQAIQSSQTLRTVSFPPFSCTDKCYEALIQMLQTNCILERIDYWVRVGHSLYYPDSNETIDHLLQLNQSGVRRIWKEQEKNGVSKEVVVELLDHYRDDLDTTFYLFSSDPSLVPRAVTDSATPS